MAPKYKLFVLSVNEFELNKVIIYPNPTNGILNIVFNTPMATIENYNNFGQLVLSVKEASSIDITSSNQGVYVMALKDISGNTMTKKVIKK